MSTKPKPLNKTKIETFDYSWGVVSGCANGCPYCYARSLVKRFSKQLGRQSDDFGIIEYHGKFHDLDMSPDDYTYFVAPLGDVFCDGFKRHYRWHIYGAMERNPDKKFYLQTKRPDRICNVHDVAHIPFNCVMGTSVTGYRDIKRLNELAGRFLNTRHKIYCHFEPLFDAAFPEHMVKAFKAYTLEKVISEGRFEWMIVGPQTNPIKQPPVEAVEQLRSFARKFNIPLWEKDALDVGLEDKIQRKPMYGGR